MDSFHTLNGQPVPNPTVTQAPTVKPVDTTATMAVKRLHTAESGDVGVVGEVGDLGSNAAK